MGVQCTIILTYYSDRRHEEIKKEIYSFLKMYYSEETRTNIDSEGNRAFGPAEMDCHVICMKDWEEKECLEFIENLKKIDWDVPKSVQVYYLPATHENYMRFKLINLFD